mgnify:CR=1 FL=1
MKHLLTVIAVLLAFACCTTEADRNRMRAGLDSINQRNRNDQPITAADVQPYVNFFDDHGTPNDRLLAHYLLGRAYHDHGEAPMALQCYQDALDCADTLSTDCDYSQLARVYGQMAQIFYEQGLYREQLSHDNLSVKYAWRGKDTLAALMSYEQESQAYRNLNMPDSLLYICEHVSQLYRKYGYTNYAARALFHTLRTFVLRKEFDKVRKNIQIYESESGYFDSHGNIQKGREIYYKIKGLYYLHTNVLDSAEYYFRKELRDGKDFGNQNSAANGLALLYNKIHKPDSAAKYAIYAYTMLDSVYAQRSTKEVERMQALYDYTRHQEIARREKERASTEKLKRQLSMAIFFGFMIFAILIIRKMYVDRKRRQVQYIQNLEQLEQTQSELLQLRSHAEEYNELIAIKESLYEEQNIVLQEQRKKNLLDHAEIDKRIIESDICNKILKNTCKKLTIEELRECRKFVLENLPEFNNLLLSKRYKINNNDFNVCVLFRLGIKSKEVSNLLGLSQGRISQICTKLLLGIFKKDKGGATELIEKLNELY